MTRPLRVETAIFDVDGTLIDSNAAHAEAWTRALREHGVAVDVTEVRRLIGMGGDKLLPRVAKLAEDSEPGRRIVQAKKAIFESLLPSLKATAGARSLLEFLRHEGVDLVIATSADDRELSALLQRAGVDDLFPCRTSKDDASTSKPDPDIVKAALAKAHATPGRSLMVGDTPYDVQAAAGAGVAIVALRCGGYWSDPDLAGALEIFDDPEALHRRWRQEPSP